MYLDNKLRAREGDEFCARGHPVLSALLCAKTAVDSEGVCLGKGMKACVSVNLEASKYRVWKGSSIEKYFFQVHRHKGVQANICIGLSFHTRYLSCHEIDACMQPVILVEGQKVVNNDA